MVRLLRWLVRIPLRSVKTHWATVKWWYLQIYNVPMYVWMYVHVSVCACMYVCAHVCMRVYMYECVHVCVSGYMYECVHVCSTDLEIFSRLRLAGGRMWGGWERRLRHTEWWGWSRSRECGGGCGWWRWCLCRAPDSTRTPGRSSWQEPLQYHVIVVTL